MVSTNTSLGTFYGGAGNDYVTGNSPYGTVYSGAGNDLVRTNNGTFDGGDGTDSVIQGNGPTINVEQEPPPSYRRAALIRKW